MTIPMCNSRIWMLRTPFLYCTMLYEAGIDLKTAQRWMGHADEKMILHVYAHLTDRQEQQSVDRLRAFMAG